MSQILTNATDTQLADALEQNLFAYFRSMSAVPGGALHEGETLSYHDACQPAPLLRGVWNARLAPEQMDAAISEMQDWFTGRGSDFVAWWFNSHTAPELLQRLETRGFEMDYSAPGMALDTATLSKTLTLPDGLEIVRARDEKTLADFSTVIYKSYKDRGMALESAQAFEMATRALGVESAPWRIYVGYMDGKPVATNLAFNGGGVTGLFCIATLPDYRGRGIGAAVTLAPLYEADADAQYAVLFSSKSGKPVYERIGFREVGMNIGRYVWYRD